MVRRSVIAMTLMFILFVIIGGLASHTVRADAILQDVPSLEGKTVYFTEANGEASRFDRSDAGLSRFAGLLSQLGANLKTLEWRTGFPNDADLIVIAGPTTDLTADQVARLWSYVNNQGRLLLLANAPVETRRALPASTGLFSLMYADMGLRGSDDVVVHAGVAEDGSPTLFATFVTTALNGSHPITAGLDQGLYFSVARSLQVDSSIQDFTVTTLATTDDTFYGETAYDQYLSAGVASFDIGVDRTEGALPLAAAFDNERTQSRIVLIGDREFAVNGKGLTTAPPNSAGFVFPDNARFLINSVTWLLETSPAVFEFPTAGPTPTATITPTPTPTPAPTATATPAS